MKFTWKKYVRHVIGTPPDCSTRITIAIDHVHVPPVTDACGEDSEKCNALGHWRAGYSALIHCGVTQTVTCVTPFPSIAKAKRGGERVARYLRAYGLEQANMRVDERTVNDALAAWKKRFATARSHA